MYNEALFVNIFFFTYMPRELLHWSKPRELIGNYFIGQSLGNYFIGQKPRELLH
jgi:hypothetical protein